ncbi:MAG: hypothetical protein HYY84_20900 [Deltaproteobacteria bacterium]|nr:hypothetical protein [Deltaproteobacteria bacterium]
MDQKPDSVESFFFMRDMARIGLLILIVVGVIVELPLLMGPCAGGEETFKEARVVTIALAILIIASMYAFTRVRSQARVEQMIRAFARRSDGQFEVDRVAVFVGIPPTHIRYVVVAMGQKGAVRPVDPLENPPQRFRVTDQVTRLR